MKNRTEKIGKFRFKMNFSLDSGTCRVSEATHPLGLNELSHRAGSVPKVSRSVIFGLSMSPAARYATFLTTTKVSMTKHPEQKPDAVIKPISIFVNFKAGYIMGIIEN